ncbi:helix-turn-helix domain-containing protein [uncultured Draconibacterium sp.]|uniref:helix-turn-helix domain-containing protein n=1 Tax=uncultured Draconibacterium sp. TaxID=1573823 RepID=UPI0029C7330A|nr:helix-turn-helix domain-containing protein [uncultured Draconibacterium sp.]
MNEPGKRIKESRLKQGWTQEDLAEHAKVNLRTIQRIENNETTPRRKTLDLLFDVLGIDGIEPEKTPLNKYVLWSAFLTVLIFVGTFLGWTRRFKMFVDGERTYRTFTGWSGYTFFNDYHLQNWLLSITSISLGLIVVANSLGLIKNKMKYILAQLVCLILYLAGVLGWSTRQALEWRPGLFLIIVATIFLVVAYRKNGAKAGANK